MDEQNIGLENEQPKTVEQRSNILTDSLSETGDSVNSGVDSITGIKDRVGTIMSDPEMSTGDKAMATGLAAVETVQSVQQAIESVTSLPQQLVDKAFTSVMSKLSFLRGIACLPIVKQLDPVIGIDVHNVFTPVPLPIPQAYIGIMFDPMDFVSVIACTVMAKITPPPPSEDSVSSQVKSKGHEILTGFAKSLGATIKIGPFIPRVVATTTSWAIPHLPPFPYVPAPPVKVVRGHAFLGSLFVYADNQPLTGGYLHLHNDCWDYGIPPIATVLQNAAKKLFGFPKQKKVEPPTIPPRVGMLELFLPTGMMMPIPWNKPILVNPVPTPINPAEAVNIFISAGFAKLREGFIGMLSNSRLGSKLGCSFWSKVSDKFGTGTSHPADVSEGHFYTKGTDFSIPGVIPLQFKRIYHSYSDYKGPLGTGWHHQYDMSLSFDYEDGLAAVRLDDGRPTGFKIPAKGESYFNRKEKLWLYHHKEGYFYLSDKKGYVYRFTEREYHNPFNKTETHLLQSISNRNGYSLRFAYDHDGVLSQITDTAGRIFTIKNDGKGHITQIFSPAAKFGEDDFVIASYEYDVEGRLIKQTNALGHSMLFKYEGRLLVKETWRNGLNWHIKYDKPGTDAKCLEVKGDGGLYHHKLDYVSSDCTIVTNSLGQKTTYYHSNGLVVKRIDPNGAETVFRYKETDLEWKSDALGNITTASYDEWGNLINRTAPDGGFTQIAYENRGFPYLPTSAIDSAGGRWKWEYDSQGNLVKRINPVKAETQFEYNDGLLSIITGAQGQQTRLQYDQYNDLTETVSPDGGRNRWWYDELGQCIRRENAREGISGFKYDLLGQVIKVNQPDGNIRELKYDEQGNVVHAKDHDRDVQFTYRGVNKLESRTERGATLRFRYDTEDQLRIVENENGEEYLFKLDVQGNVIEEIGFDGLNRKYYRNQAGQVISVIRPSGEINAYEYDQTGRVTKVIYHPDEKDQQEETYEYRKDGLLIKAINEHATVELQRDVLGRVVKEICNGNEVNSEYDLINNRIRITSSLGADIHAGYNLMGDVISLANDGWQTQYERDLFGLETGRSLAGGIHTYTDRDSLGRVTSHKIEKNQHSLSEKDYLWGTNDKLLAIIAEGKETQFEYDQWGNLSKTLFDDGKVEYRNPDKAGNLFESLDRSDRKYTKGGQLIKTERWEYKYDKEGNLVRKKGKDGQIWRYEWNATGMLIKVKRPDAHEITFKYDALGRRIEKRMGRHITKWTWDGNIPLHEQKETHNQDYEQDKGHFINIDKQPLITWIFEEGTFAPVARVTEKQKLSIVTNYMGTPEAMYREDGEPVWKCELNSYGKVRNFQGEYKTECPFRYQGQYEDSETGLYYNRFRYYSPEEGIYISQDPIRLYSGNKSLYGYVRDSNNWIDPLGLSGGSYGSVRGNSTGGEVHHMPAASATKKAQNATGNKALPSYSQAPAIWMTKEDHAQTASYRNVEGAREHRAQQQAYIEDGNYAEAMRLDIQDINNKYASGDIKNDYTDDMIEAVNYAEGKGYIEPEEAEDLRNECKK